MCIQAKLYEVMTSSVDQPPPSSSKPDQPWMVDGGGMPDNSLELMKKLVRSLVIPLAITLVIC